MERLLTGSGGAGLRVRAEQTGRADKRVKEERALRHTDVLPLLSNHQHHHHINLTCSLRQLLSLFQNDKSHRQGTFPSSANPQILGDQAFWVLILTPPSKHPTSDWVAPRWPAQPHHCCLPPPSTAVSSGVPNDGDPGGWGADRKRGQLLGWPVCALGVLGAPWARRKAVDRKREPHKAAAQARGPAPPGARSQVPSAQ